VTGRSDPTSPPEASHRFDELARAIAMGISRRQAVKLAAAALVAGSLPSWALRPSRALAAHPVENCPCPWPNCPPAPDPITVGCENNYNGGFPGSTQTTTWTPSCQFAVASGQTIHYNGCGPEKGIDIGPLHNLEPPDHPLGLANFEMACDAHDCCYGTCQTEKATCDSDFLNSLLDACAASATNLLAAIAAIFCDQIALLYYAAVAAGGEAAYNDAQGQACVCCDCQGCTLGEGCCGQDCGGGAEGLTQCPSGCTNLMNDPYNCGSCGNACPTTNSPNYYCNQGVCGCPPGSSACGQVCCLTDEEICCEGSSECCDPGCMCTSDGCEC